MKAESLSCLAMKPLTRLFFLIVVGVLGNVTGFSQEVPPSEKNPRIFEGRDRTFCNSIARDIPLKVVVRNLDGDRWAHNLELEVTNAGQKPIYFMHMYIIPLGFKNPATGHRWGFLLHYGRMQLISLSEPLTSADVPLLPGEKHTFKIVEGIANGWEQTLRTSGEPEPKVFELILQSINYGDGTGHQAGSNTLTDVNKKVRQD